MDCRHSRGLVNLYVDGELDVDRRTRFVTHVNACADCARQLASAAALRDSIRAAAPRFAAPAGLAATICHSLDQAAAAQRPHRGRWHEMMRLAASFAAVAVLSASLTWIAVAPGGPRVDGDGLTAALVDGHVHALMTNQVTSVLSSDQHTVKPWFAGRVEVSPPATDFAAEGFPLIGGRVDHVGGRSAAVIVYGHRRHLIDVYVWSGADAPATVPQAASRNGYNVSRWREGGLAFAAVSDLNPDDLGRLVALIRGR